MKNIVNFIRIILILSFAGSCIASPTKIFYIRNQIINPNALGYATFQLNEENNSVCTLNRFGTSGSFGCPTEKFITVDYAADKAFIFTLTSFKTTSSGESFTNIDASCINHTLSVKPDQLPIVDIIGRPTNILGSNTLITCEYKDYE